MKYLSLLLAILATVLCAVAINEACPVDRTAAIYFATLAAWASGWIIKQEL